MDGTLGYYAKWDKSDGERQIPYGFTHMWNFKDKQPKQNKWTNQTKPNQNKHIDIENRIVVPRRERVGVGKMEVIKCMFNMETKILGVSML